MADNSKKTPPKKPLSESELEDVAGAGGGLQAEPKPQTAGAQSSGGGYVTSVRFSRDAEKAG